MDRIRVYLVGLLLLPCVSAATEFRGGDHVVIAKDEVITGDLYASGTDVIVDGVVTGDLVAVGREISVNGRVEGDFIAAGQTVIVRGFVGDDARIAGMVLHLGAGATISDHLVGAGYSFEAAPGSRVGGDAHFAGAKARTAGAFGSGLRVTSTALEIGGSVVGDAVVELANDGKGGVSWLEGFFSGSVPPPLVTEGLTVLNSARIGGTLSYASPDELPIPDVAEGGTAWTPSRTASEPGDAEATPMAKLLTGIGAQLRRFVALMICGLLLVGLAPRWVRRQGDRLQAAPIKSLGWGVAGLFGIPVVVFAVLLVMVTLATLVGKLSLGGLVSLVILLGSAVLLGVVACSIVATGFAAQVLVSTAAGRAALRRTRPAHAAGRWPPLVVGLLLFALVTGLPYLGTFVALVVAALGLGLVGQWLYSVLRHRQEVVHG